MSKKKLLLLMCGVSLLTALVVLAITLPFIIKGEPQPTAAVEEVEKDKPYMMERIMLWSTFRCATCDRRQILQPR